MSETDTSAIEGRVRSHVEWSILCPRCKDFGDVDQGGHDSGRVRTRKDALREFRHLGWRQRDGLWTCPKCVALLTPEAPSDAP
jgi:hypothetical protein